jgi:hypothetical protein
MDEIEFGERIGHVVCIALLLNQRERGLDRKNKHP